MNFILIDGEICVVTHFTCDEEIDTQQIGSSRTHNVKTVATGHSISGEMLVFRQGSLPNFFEQNGMPNPVTIEYKDDTRLYTLDDALFTSFRPMPHAYDKCEAAYCEYVATDIQIDKMITETIRVGSSK